MNAKPWFLSNTQWGILLSAIFTILNRIIDVSPEIIEWAASPEAANAMTTFATLFCLIYAAWGRARAKGPTTFVPSSLKNQP